MKEPKNPIKEKPKSQIGEIIKPSNVSAGIVVKNDTKAPPKLQSFIEEIDGRGLVKIAFSEPIDMSLITAEKL